MEEQLTSALQAAADKVKQGYAGEPVDEIEARLLAETKTGLHPDIAAGWSPDQAELRRVAQTIVNGA